MTLPSAKAETQEKSKAMKFDELFPIIGNFGRYQKRIYIILCLPTICCAMHKLAWVFLGAKIDHRYLKYTSLII